MLDKCCLIYVLSYFIQMITLVCLKISVSNNLKTLYIRIGLSKRQEINGWKCKVARLLATVEQAKSKKRIVMQPITLLKTIYNFSKSKTTMTLHSSKKYAKKMLRQQAVEQFLIHSAVLNFALKLESTLQQQKNKQWCQYRIN